MPSSDSSYIARLGRGDQVIGDINSTNQNVTSANADWCVFQDPATTTDACVSIATSPPAGSAGGFSLFFEPLIQGVFDKPDQMAATPIPKAVTSGEIVTSTEWIYRYIPRSSTNYHQAMADRFSVGWGVLDLLYPTA